VRNNIPSIRCDQPKTNPNSGFIRDLRFAKHILYLKSVRLRRMQRRYLVPKVIGKRKEALDPMFRWAVLFCRDSYNKITEWFSELDANTLHWKVTIRTIHNFKSYKI
jgi:hypothetical protein